MKIRVGRRTAALIAGSLIAATGGAAVAVSHPSSHPAHRGVVVARWDSTGWVPVTGHPGEVFRTGLTSDGRQVEVTCKGTPGTLTACTTVVDDSEAPQTT